MVDQRRCPRPAAARRRRRSCARRRRRWRRRSRPAGSTIAAISPASPIRRPASPAISRRASPATSASSPRCSRQSRWPPTRRTSPRTTVPASASGGTVARWSRCAARIAASSAGRSPSCASSAGAAEAPNHCPQVRAGANRGRPRRRSAPARPRPARCRARRGAGPDPRPPAAAARPPRPGGARRGSPRPPTSPARKAPAKTGSPTAQSSSAAERARPRRTAAGPSRSAPAAAVREGAGARPSLPDADPALGRQVERLAGAGAEGGIPGIEVADHGGALLGGRVRIGQEPLDQIRLAIFAPPDLRPAEIEALVAGEAVERRRRPSPERMAIGVVGDGEPGQIGDILAERQLRPGCGGRASGS